MKDYGWVIRYGNCFLADNEMYVDDLKSAQVFKTRRAARDDRFDEDVVYKVSLYKNGKAKKVIGRG